MHTHVLDLIEVFSFLKGIVASSEHLAHIVRLLSQQRIALASTANVASLLAPEGGRVVPLEGLLAGGVAHATIIVPIVGQSC